MGNQPVRSFTRLAVAIVIAAVIVSAGALSYSSFESTVTKTTVSTATSTQVSVSTLTTTSTVVSTETVTTTCNQGSAITNFDAHVLPQNSTTDCALGITLGLEANSSTTAGVNETVYLSLTNDLPMARNVNYTGPPTLPNGLDLSSAAAYDYVLPLQPACAYPSTSSYEPAFIAVYNGSGAPVQLNDSPVPIVSCITSLSQTYHPFNASQTITETISIAGYYTSTDASEPWVNATHSPLSPGNYTLVAFDPWGQLTELGFTVAA